MREAREPVGQHRKRRFGGDAQKIGKNDGSYTLALDAFETELLKLAQNG